MKLASIKKSRVFIVGASGHGLVIFDILSRSNTAEVVGFLDSAIPEDTVHAGSKVFGSVEAISDLCDKHSVTDCVVAVGHNDVRRSCVERIRAACPGLKFPKVIHPAAVVAKDVKIGEGTVIVAGVIINPGCEIGLHCILNTGSQLDHESKMGDFSSLAPGAVTGGNVVIGAGAAICLGVSIIHGIRIGEKSVVGAGSVVLHDVPSLCVAYGNPARRIRGRSPEENYLEARYGKKYIND